jgi:hypothetical protein
MMRTQLLLSLCWVLGCAVSVEAADAAGGGGGAVAPERCASPGDLDTQELSCWSAPYCPFPPDLCPCGTLALDCKGSWARPRCTVAPLQDFECANGERTHTVMCCGP